MQDLVEEGYRRKEAAAAEGFGPHERIVESQVHVNDRDRSEPVDALLDAWLVGSVPAWTVKRYSSVWAFTKAPAERAIAARAQGDSTSSSSLCPVLVHAAQRDDDATRGGIGEAPEPALHFAPM